jgi:adenylate cyclase
MGIEIERKFLVDHKLWNQLSKPKGVNFSQGYILKQEAKTIRIRVTDEDGFITIKGKSVGFSRSEFEYTIPIGEAKQLLADFCEAVVIKIRYRIDFEGKVWEVDVFSGENEGLIVAEIELDDAKEIFNKPGWVGQEVTDDVRYYNSNLSEHPFKKWHKKRC